MDGMTFTVTTVCSGNICRSPIAHVVLEKAFDDAGLGAQVTVNSAGTGAWHLGSDMDDRARTVLESAGLDASGHRARQFTEADFALSDLILVADEGHYRELTALAPDAEAASRVHLIRTFDPEAEHTTLFDPYYGELTDFEATYDAVTATVPGIVEHVRGALQVAS